MGSSNGCRRSFRTWSALAFFTLMFAPPAGAQVLSPFEQDVNAAIADGVGWLRAQNAFTANGGGRENGRPLATLALMEQSDGNQAGGYNTLSPGDQNLARTAIRLIINNGDCGANRGLYAYCHGSALMALSLFAQTGGPDNVGANRTVRQAMDKMTDETLNGQTTAGGNSGFWGYTGTGNDSSTTQFAAAGLSASRGYYLNLGDPGNRVPSIVAALNRTAEGYDRLQRADGGFGYRTSGYASSYQQTASGMWCSLLGNRDLNAASTQGYLNWQRNMYNYNTIDGARNNWRQAYYYFLWSSSKAYRIMESEQPDPGVLTPTSLGLLAAAGSRLARRNPEADPRVPRRGPDGAGFYTGEAPGWYYDYAYTLMGQQDAAGLFSHNGHPRWNTYAEQAYALLVLQRSLGAACVDADRDDVCDEQDVCPNLPNPDQADADEDGVGDQCDNCVNAANEDQRDVDGDGRGDACDVCPNDPADNNGADGDNDGVGDVCDNCPQQPNGDQVDDDNDGIGDACDPYVCAPTNGGVEICDGLDNDCDREVDELLAGVGQRCDSGLEGVCTNGILECRGAAGLFCNPGIRPDTQPEVCDNLDNDCDGQTDEALSRTCYDADPDTRGVGLCRGGVQVCVAGDFGACEGQVLPAIEICDGLDNDCNGAADDNALGAGERCESGLLGACAGGVRVCNGAEGLACVPDALPDAAPEICDNIDNDCDGRVDEGLVRNCFDGPDGARGVGVCTDGQQTCQAGDWGMCVGQVLPAGEICDGLDNDCDGAADDNPQGAGDRCDSGLLGACAGGVQRCDGVQGLTCVPDAQPDTAPEVCDNIDNDCDGVTDESLIRRCYDGPPDTREVGICADGAQTCRAGDWGGCSGQVLPVGEVCDGQDNDCNGIADDNPAGEGGRCETDLVGACGRGVQVCNGQGGLVCQPDAVPDQQVETCNNIDDDCDGRIDEALIQDCYSGAEGTEGVGLCRGGSQTCDAGAWGVCVGEITPGDEVCDNQDSDCDGVVDEALTRPCYDGPDGTLGRGRCQQGVSTCGEGAWGACMNQVMPSDEVCDGADNNCNGIIDEDDPQLSAECDTGVPGLCGPGIFFCEEGALTCMPEVEPAVEMCDGIDNDCDGMIDEATPGSDERCITGEPGICAFGQTACVAGVMICSPSASPEEEACDGLDNNCDGVIDEDLRNRCGQCGADAVDACNGDDEDCDGVIDEDANCPGAQQCVEGQCFDPCRNNECPGELQCVFGVCADACDVVACEEGERCEAGECIDLCAEVDCGAGQVCRAGQCVGESCYEAGCPEGERCVEGACAGDPCSGVACGDGEFCREGECVGACADVACPGDQICQNGACQPHPCAGVECPEGRVCEEGQCVADACEGVDDCGAGRRCINGECADDPCAFVDCLPGQRCDLDEAGLPQCYGEWTEPEPGMGGMGGGMGGAGGMGGMGGGMGGDGGAGGEPMGGAGGEPMGGAGGEPMGGTGGDDGMGGVGGDGAGGADAGLDAPDADPLNTGDAGDPGAQDPEEVGCTCDVSRQGGPDSGDLIWLMLIALPWLRRRARQ